MRLAAVFGRRNRFDVGPWRVASTRKRFAWRGFCIELKAAGIPSSWLHEVSRPNSSARNPGRSDRSTGLSTNRSLEEWFSSSKVKPRHTSLSPSAQFSGCVVKSRRRKWEVWRRDDSERKNGLSKSHEKISWACHLYRNIPKHTQHKFAKTELRVGSSKTFLAPPKPLRNNCSVFLSSKPPGLPFKRRSRATAFPTAISVAEPGGSGEKEVGGLFLWGKNGKAVVAFSVLWQKIAVAFLLSVLDDLFDFWGRRQNPPIGLSFYVHCKSCEKSTLAHPWPCAGTTEAQCLGRNSGGLVSSTALVGRSWGEDESQAWLDGRVAQLHHMRFWVKKTMTKQVFFIFHQCN